MNKRIILMGKQKSYQQKIKSLFGSSIVAYWPGNELSGTVATDISGYLRNGVYTGGSLNNATNTVGKPVPLYTTPIGGINLGGSASLLAAFNGDEGACIVTMKMSAVGNWDTAVLQDYLLRLTVDANSSTRLYHTAAARFLTLNRSCQGENKTPYAWLYPSDWVNLIASWSVAGGYLKLMVNGTLQNSIANAAITQGWLGAIDPTIARLFAFQAPVTASSLRGWGSDVILLNRPVTDAEALTVSKIMLPGLKTFAFIGDSISAATAYLKYPTIICNETYGGLWRQCPHAISGGGIIDGSLATQVAAAATDDADAIIVASGTNDDNAGNMTTLQATVETNLAALKLSNPRATIYYMNVLPRWTDVGGGTEVDKGNIRTAIAAACTAQGITCWDTYTTPWIAATDTTDGLHPTFPYSATSGHRYIADQILLLIPA